MSPIVLALAAIQAVPAVTSAQSCAALARSAPEKAIEAAGAWRLQGGGLSARHCLGLAYAQLERWESAATAFEQAASEAETAKDTRRGDFWVQAGNAWLAAGDAGKARAALDSALVAGISSPELRGEVHLDRARAAVALGSLAAARSDIELALNLVPGDPFAWVLSSALAIKEEQVGRARADVARATELAPDDPDVLLQAGNVAGVSGEIEQARSLFAKAAKTAPASPAGRAAAAALAANAGEVEAAPPAQALPSPPKNRLP
jgi:tetratricopeptide (TPR) repeat protein